MKKCFAAFAAVLAVSAGFVVAAEIQSGLEKGKGVPPFNVKDVTGPNKDGDEKMAGFVVLMTETPEKAAPALAAAAKKHKISQMPLTTYAGAKGPDGYKLNAKADVTVMMWVDGKVKVSQGLNTSDLNKETIAKLVGETKNILE